MSTELLLHPLVAKSVKRYLAAPTHALLLLAPEGSGKAALGNYLAAELVQVAPGKVLEYPFMKTVTPERGKTAISIETVRELQQFTKLKLPSTTARRIISIPNADTMTHEAQNALLKLLEEPPANTYFILTAANGQQLLETVRSRVQALDVRRPGREAIEQYFATHGFDTPDIQQAYFMSGGLVGLIHALLSDTEHPLRASAQAARQLLQANQFERLCKVDELSKQRTEALQTLFMLRQMAVAAIERAGDNQAVQRWRGILAASYDAESALLQNASAKLALTNLMLEL